jgi:formaldehyde-activating enzyme involved in methanogenesis
LNKQSRKLYENWISSWYGALQQILNNIPKLKQLSTNQKVSKQTLETVKKTLKNAFHPQISPELHC